MACSRQCPRTSSTRAAAGVGAGVQARSHLAAISVVRPLSEVLVWNQRRERAEDFQRWAETTLSCPVTVCAPAAEAAKGADVVDTNTASASPVLGSPEIADGAHINAVGSSSRPGGS